MARLVAQADANDKSCEPHPGANSVDPVDFAIAVCTVDGQQLSCGSRSLKFPLMEAVMPLIYAVGLKDCGIQDVHEVCASVYRVEVLLVLWVWCVLLWHKLPDWSL